MDHPRGLHDDAANALCGSTVMAARTEVLRTPPPSYGLSEPIESEREKMDREAKEWLLDLPKKKKIISEFEIDVDTIREEVEAWERKFSLELRNKDKRISWMSLDVSKSDFKIILDHSYPPDD